MRQLPTTITKVINDIREENLSMLESEDIVKYPDIKNTCINALGFCNEIESRLQYEYFGRGDE